VVNAISNTGHFISTNLLQTELLQDQGKCDFQEDTEIEAVRLLLGHASVANTSRYLGVENEAALELAQMIKLR
jgi:hypothetical protein